jgi:hypothetical protein
MSARKANLVEAQGSIYVVTDMAVTILFAIRTNQLRVD